MNIRPDSAALLGAENLDLSKVMAGSINLLDSLAQEYGAPAKTHNYAKADKFTVLVDNNDALPGILQDNYYLVADALYHARNALFAMINNSPAPRTDLAELFQDIETWDMEAPNLKPDPNDIAQSVKNLTTLHNGSTRALDYTYNHLMSPVAKAVIDFVNQNDTPQAKWVSVVEGTETFHVTIPGTTGVIAVTSDEIAQFNTLLNPRVDPSNPNRLITFEEQFKAAEVEMWTAFREFTWREDKAFILDTMKEWTLKTGEPLHTITAALDNHNLNAWASHDLANLMRFTNTMPADVQARVQDPIVQTILHDAPEKLAADRNVQKSLSKVETHADLQALLSKGIYGMTLSEMLTVGEKITENSALLAVAAAPEVKQQAEAEIPPVTVEVVSSLAERLEQLQPRRSIVDVIEFDNASEQPQEQQQTAHRKTLLERLAAMSNMARAPQGAAPVDIAQLTEERLDQVTQDTLEQVADEVRLPPAPQLEMPVAPEQQTAQQQTTPPPLPEQPQQDRPYSNHPHDVAAYNLRAAWKDLAQNAYRMAHAVYPGQVKPDPENRNVPHFTTLVARITEIDNRMRQLEQSYRSTSLDGDQAFVNYRQGMTKTFGMMKDFIQEPIFAEASRKLTFGLSDHIKKFGKKADKKLVANLQARQQTLTDAQAYMAGAEQAADEFMYSQSYYHPRIRELTRGFGQLLDQHLETLSQKSDYKPDRKAILQNLYQIAYSDRDALGIAYTLQVADMHTNAWMSKADPELRTTVENAAATRDEFLVTLLRKVSADHFEQNGKRKERKTAQAELATHPKRLETVLRKMSKIGPACSRAYTAFLQTRQMPEADLPSQTQPQAEPQQQDVTAGLQDKIAQATNVIAADLAARRTARQNAEQAQPAQDKPASPFPWMDQMIADRDAADAARDRTLDPSIVVAANARDPRPMEEVLADDAARRMAEANGGQQVDANGLNDYFERVRAEREGTALPVDDIADQVQNDPAHDDVAGFANRLVKNPPTQSSPRDSAPELVLDTSDLRTPVDPAPKQKKSPRILKRGATRARLAARNVADNAGKLRASVADGAKRAGTATAEGARRLRDNTAGRVRVGDPAKVRNTAAALLLGTKEALKKGETRVIDGVHTTFDWTGNVIKAVAKIAPAVVIGGGAGFVVRGGLGYGIYALGAIAVPVVGTPLLVAGILAGVAAGAYAGLQTSSWSARLTSNYKENLGQQRWWNAVGKATADASREYWSGTLKTKRQAARSQFGNLWTEAYAETRQADAEAKQTRTRNAMRKLSRPMRAALVASRNNSEVFTQTVSPIIGGFFGGFAGGLAAYLSDALLPVPDANTKPLGGMFDYASMDGAPRLVPDEEVVRAPLKAPTDVITEQAIPDTTVKVVPPLTLRDGFTIVTRPDGTIGYEPVTPERFGINPATPFWVDPRNTVPLGEIPGFKVDPDLLRTFRFPDTPTGVDVIPDARLRPGIVETNPLVRKVPTTSFRIQDGVVVETPADRAGLPVAEPIVVDPLKALNEAIAAAQNNTDLVKAIAGHDPVFKKLVEFLEAQRAAGADMTKIDAMMGNPASPARGTIYGGSFTKLNDLLNDVSMGRILDRTGNGPRIAGFTANRDLVLEMRTSISEHLTSDMFKKPGFKRAFNANTIYSDYLTGKRVPPTGIRRLGVPRLVPTS